MFPILIIEDDPNIRLAIRSILSSGGLDPVMCRTPPLQEALLDEVAENLLQAQPVAAVVDLGLPEPEQGEAVLDLLSERSSDLPLVLLTGSSSSARAAQTARRFGAHLVSKGPQMAVGLKAGLEGCWRHVRHLDWHVQSYLHTIEKACEQWEHLKGRGGSSMLELLREEKDSLSRDLQAPLSCLEEALSGPDWPLPAKQLVDLRLQILSLVQRLPQEHKRLAHLLSHRVANNFLLGAEFIQETLGESAYPERLLEAARHGGEGRELRRGRLRLLEDVAAILQGAESREQAETVLGLQRVFSESRRSSTKSLTGSGPLKPMPFHKVLLVENDETLYRLLEWAVQPLVPGVPIQGCDCAHLARRELDGETSPETLLLLLDLSIPRQSGSLDEHFDFGLEVLRAARARGAQVIVTSGIAEVPEAIGRALHHSPLAFLPKTSPNLLRSRLREQLARLPGRPIPAGETLYVLRNRGRQVQYNSEIIEVGEPAVSLLRVLAASRNGTLHLDDVCDHGDLAHHFWQKGNHLDPSRPKNYVKSLKDAVRKANQAVQRSLRARGIKPKAIVSIDSSQVCSLVPLEVIPPESEAPPGLTDGLLSEEVEPKVRPAAPPRPLKVLVVDPLEPYAQCVARWIEQGFPSWRDQRPAAQVAGTLEEARQALADLPFDIVVLEIRTRHSGRPSFKAEGTDVREALEWLRSVAGAPTSPDFIILTASTDSVDELDALSACPDLRHYLHKSTDQQTRAELCLALEDLFHRRFGFPVDRPRGTLPLFQVQQTAQGRLLLDGVEVRFDERQPLTAPRWAAPIVLELLAGRPGLPLGSERLLQELRERAEAEIARKACEIPEERARMEHPLYGAGRSRRRSGNDEDPDELPDNLLSRIIEECRTAILLSMAARGRHLAFKDSISMVGQKTYVLNGARLEPPPPPR
jgi:CheY-like chemotaxis protein